MQITIDETTARMAVIAMRERADRMRADAKARRYTGAAFIKRRASLRKNAAIIDQRADALEATYARKATAPGSKWELGA